MKIAVIADQAIWTRALRYKTLMVCAQWPGFARSAVDPLFSLEVDLAELQAVAKTPVTSRFAWWCAAIDADPDATPMVFSRARPSGALDAAGFMMLREADGGTTRWLTGGRPGSDDAWEIAARSARAKRDLAEELADEFGTWERPWRLQLTAVREVDAGLDVLVGHLPNARLLPSPAVPRVRFHTDASAPALLRTSVREGLVRSARRIARDGLCEELRFERRRIPLLAMQADLEEAHRARDHDAGRRSDLDDEASCRFWHSVYRYHAVRDELEVATLHLDGHLAAYVIAFVDTPVYRVFDGRFVPSWRRYSPGRRLEAAVLERAFRDASVHELDWMSSIAPDRLIAANGAEPRWTLVAGSDAALLTDLELAAAG